MICNICVSLAGVRRRLLRKYRVFLYRGSRVYRDGP